LSAAGKTVSLYKKRQRIHPREVHGLFQRWRWFFVFLTQAVFYGLPWLQWTTELGQRQAVLFDLGPSASTCSAWCCTRRTSSTWPGC
jgi:hypothetical protein